MKRFQSILCASLLTFAISASAFAGDISGGKTATAAGDISGGKTVTAAGDISGGKTVTAGDISGGFALTNYILSTLAIMIR